MLAREWHLGYGGVEWLLENPYWFTRYAIFTNEEASARPYREAHYKKEREVEQQRARNEANRELWRTLHAHERERGGEDVPPLVADGPRAI